MLKLYEITGEYLTLCQMAEDTDVDATVFADTLASIQGELEVKADRIFENQIRSENGENL